MLSYTEKMNIWNDSDWNILFKYKLYEEAMWIAIKKKLKELCKYMW